LDSNFPSSEESNAEDGTSGKLTGLAILSPLQLFTLDSNFPSSEESNAEDGTSGKLTGLAILSPQNVPFR